jgi:hypothetical protein
MKLNRSSELEVIKVKEDRAKFGSTNMIRRLA